MSHCRICRYLRLPLLITKHGESGCSGCCRKTIRESFHLPQVFFPSNGLKKTRRECLQAKADLSELIIAFITLVLGLPRNAYLRPSTALLFTATIQITVPI